MTTAQLGGAAELTNDDNTTAGLLDAKTAPRYLRDLLPTPSPSPLPSPLSPLSGDTTDTTTVTNALTHTQTTERKEEQSEGKKRPFKNQPKINYIMAQPSGVTQEGLIAALKDKVGATHVEIEDMSGGCGQAFSALIVSPLFEKKTTLARHRMVNTALKEEVAAIHAWTPKCYTPEQWGNLQGKEGGTPQAPGRGTNGEVVEGTTA